MEAARQLQPIHNDDNYRLAPHNIEAEQALLGAILVNNEAFYRVSDFLDSAHFYEPVHRDIYDVLSQLIRAGKTATPVTGATTSWAIRMPRTMVNASSPKLTSSTFTSPR